MADWEEAAGISAPLYEIVDTVFELQSRGFFRRQVTLPCTAVACAPCGERMQWEGECAACDVGHPSTRIP